MTSKPTEQNQLKKKDRVSGKVVKTTLSGALVDIGLQQPAVIPISQLRKEPVRRVDEVLKEGDQVDAWVRRTQRDGGRIELTLVEPRAIEWREIKKGMTLKGKVSRIEKFGAFVELGAERPGLIHVSELSHEYVRKPEDAVKLGEDIEVRVLEVNRRKKQIKLSLKALHPKPIPVEEEEKVVKVKEEDEEDAPTAMEAALRKAMQPQDGEANINDKEETRGKEISEDMEAILARTLESRVKSK